MISLLRCGSCAGIAAAVAAGVLTHAGVARASVPGPAWTAYVANQTSNTVTPIDTATNTAGSAIPAGTEPGAIAITPNGKTAYVVNTGSNNVTPIDTATNTPGRPIPVGSFPTWIAIAPNGRTAYVTNEMSNTVTPIDTATNAPEAAIHVGANPYGIAITPDGTTAYVANLGGNSVTPIALATGVAGTAIAVGTDPWDIAIAPDGLTVYVTDVRSNDVTPIEIATNTAGAAIPVGAGPVGIAITPDGTTAYVASVTGDTVTPIDLSTDTAGTPIAFPDGTAVIAITPDGKTAYVTSNGSMSSPGTVTPIDTATNVVGSAITVGVGAAGIAITPDQAPLARLSVVDSALGSLTVLDASASTVAFGSIASYAWDFGDGHVATTTTPTTTHQYAAAGLYIATVTETSSGGTSTSQVFTGTTMSRNGGPSARVLNYLTVVPPGAYTGLAPYRICDTRAKPPVNQCTGHPLGTDSTLAVHVTGETGPVGQSVPADALAVVVNVTALGTTGVSSVLSVFPNGGGLSHFSNLNFEGSPPRANLVIVQLGVSGEILVHNAVGAAGILIDVEGYFAPPGTAPVAGTFHTMPPLRICDTRAGKNTECDGPTQSEPLGGLTWRRVVLSGVPPGAAGGTASIPADGTAAAAVFNLTVTEGTQATYLAVATPNPTTDACPSKAPSASNLNPNAGEALPNRVMANLGPHQDICVFNAAGHIQVIIDLNGWFGNGHESTTGALFYSVPPTRICDTRTHSGTECAGRMLTPKGIDVITVAGVQVVPAEGGFSPVAVVANLTGVGGTAPTVFTLYPSDASRPLASDLNPGAGMAVANLAIVGLATTGVDYGDVSLYNGVGDINAILDVAGWFQ